VRLFGEHLRPDTTLLARPYHRTLFNRVALALALALELGDQLTGLAAWSRSRHQGPEPPQLWFVRFKRWMRRFRGVASRYLDHYLVWFRRCDPGSRAPG
jgi:hypothetical protein